MSAEHADTDGERIAFLAGAIASISHELKNALATISETAGLLGDILASPGGIEEEVEEFRGGVKSIAEEIDRSLRVIRNLNRLAHSGDAPSAEVDVTALLDLTAAIAAYRSYAGRARVDGPELRLVTNPLLLEEFAYRLLDSIWREVGRDAPVEIGIRAAEGGAEIRFLGPFAGAEGGLPAGADPRILAALGGAVLTPANPGELRVRLPSSEK